MILCSILNKLFLKTMIYFKKIKLKYMMAWLRRFSYQYRRGPFFKSKDFQKNYRGLSIDIIDKLYNSDEEKKII